MGLFLYLISRIISTFIMTFEIIFQILLLGLALSMDAFAASFTDGLIYTDINKKKIFFINRTQKMIAVRKIELKNEHRTHCVRIGQVGSSANNNIDAKRYCFLL